MDGAAWYWKPFNKKPHSVFDTNDLLPCAILQVLDNLGQVFIPPDVDCTLGSLAIKANHV